MRPGTVRRAPAPESIVAQVTDPETRGVLSSVVRQSMPQTSLAVCDRVDKLLGSVREKRPGTVIAQPRDATGAGIAAAAAALARLDQPPRLVMLFGFTLAEIDEICAVLATGLAVLMVPRWAQDAGDLGEALRTALVDPPDQGAERVMLGRIVPHVEPSLRPFFAACVLRASHELTVSDAALRAGFAVRTIEERLSRAGYPLARAIVAWHRVLHAAWRLDVRGLSIKQVTGNGVRRLGSRRGLANLVKRYAGLPLTQLRQPGCFAALLYRFSALLGLWLRKTPVNAHGDGGS